MSTAADLSSRDLTASYYTLSGAPTGRPSRFGFEERVAAAAEAGFAGVGMSDVDYTALLASGRTDAELRSVLDEHDVCVAELEFLRGWARDGEAATRAHAAEEIFYRMAGALGARQLNVGDIIRPGGDGIEDLDRAAERFAALCDRAAEHGLLVALEFLPFSDIRDEAVASRFVEAAGRPNGGLLVDSWHHFRGANDLPMLEAVPPERVLGIQFDDADAEPVGDLLEDSMHRRLPGEGVFDLVGFIRTLDRMGVDAPIAVEVISAEQQALPVREAARRAFETSAAVIAEARSR